MADLTRTPIERTDVLYRIKRGLASYVSYLAACEMNQAFSEYVLYEPILRILTARGFSVQCEYPCPGVAHAATGDKKRIDFYATRHALTLAIEVKWAKTKSPNVTGDLAKLRALAAAQPEAVPLICIFGRKSVLDQLVLSDPLLTERGKARVADLGITRFGCRIFELKASGGGKQ